MVEQEAYYQINGWGWVWFAYFFGILITFMMSTFILDDFFFSKKKKFSWFAFITILIFSAFSWFGLIAMLKFEKRNNKDSFRY